MPARRATPVFDQMRLRNRNHLPPLPPPHLLKRRERGNDVTDRSERGAPRSGKRRRMAQHILKPVGRIGLPHLVETVFRMARDLRRYLDLIGGASRIDACSRKQTMPIVVTRQRQYQMLDVDLPRTGSRRDSECLVADCEHVVIDAEPGAPIIETRKWLAATRAPGHDCRSADPVETARHRAPGPIRADQSTRLGHLPGQSSTETVAQRYARKEKYLPAHRKTGRTGRCSYVRRAAVTPCVRRC